MRFYSEVHLAPHGRTPGRAARGAPRYGDGKPGGVGWAAEPEASGAVAFQGAPMMRGGFISPLGIETPGAAAGGFSLFGVASRAFTGEPLVPPWAPSLRAVR
jgi:hypothetical protein